MPDAFFSEVMPAISDLATLKVALHVLWRVKRRPPGEPPALRQADLATDAVLLRSLAECRPDGTRAPVHGSDSQEERAEALVAACVDRLVAAGWLVDEPVPSEAGPQRWVWPNTPESRRHHQRWAERGTGLPETDVARAAAAPARSNVYALYEEDVGVLTPLIAEEIEEAESIYPSGWIEDAIRIAAENNARRWSYVRAILERWERDGRGDEADRRGGKEVRGRDSDGPFADVVRH